MDNLLLWAKFYDYVLIFIMWMLEYVLFTVYYF